MKTSNYYLHGINGQIVHNAKSFWEAELKERELNELSRKKESVADERQNSNNNSIDGGVSGVKSTSTTANNVVGGKYEA